MKNRLLKTQDLIILFFASLFVLFTNLSIILNYISGDIDTLQNFSDFTEKYVSPIGTYITDNLLSSNIATVLIWAAFGLVCYFVVSFLKIEFQDVLKIFNLHGYVEPKGTKKYSFINFVIELLVTFLLVVSLIIWIVYTTTVLIPTSSSLVLVALYESSTVFSAVGYAALSIFTVFLVVYIPILLYRLAKIAVNRN